MNIAKTIQEDRQAKLAIEYTPEEFEGFKRRAAKKVSKNAKIPGFRPGKAPYQVIVNHYGEGVIIQEAFDLLIEKDYPKILDQAEIEPSGAGNLESMDSMDPPKFVLMVPLSPEIDLGDYREIRKDFILEDLDQSAVDNYILSLRRNSATIVPADHPAEVGNLVYFNLSGEFLNPGEDEELSITDKTPQQVIIPAENETPEHEWPFPGFSKELLGVKENDSKEIQHTYPADYQDEEFQGKTAIFTVAVQSIKELELPEFDDDFVQSLGSYDSPEDFRNKLEEQLIKEHETDYEQNYISDLLTEIIEKSRLNYPPQMLEHEVEHMLEDIKERLKKQNMDYETYLKLRGIDEDKLVDEEIRPTAQQRLERSLVVNAVIDEEGLKLEKDLLNEQIENVMNEILRSGNAEELQKDMGSNEFSRMVSMESVSRTMDILVKNRLKLIATGQPIPEVDESEDVEDEVEGESELSEEIADLELKSTEVEPHEPDEKNAPEIDLEIKTESPNKEANTSDDLSELNASSEEQQKNADNQEQEE